MITKVFPFIMGKNAHHGQQCPSWAAMPTEGRDSHDPRMPPGRWLEIVIFNFLSGQTIITKTTASLRLWPSNAWRSLYRRSDPVGAPLMWHPPGRLYKGGYWTWVISGQIQGTKDGLPLQGSHKRRGGLYCSANVLTHRKSNILGETIIPSKQN